MKKLLLPLLLLLASFPLLRARWVWEHRDRIVTLCVDGAEVEAAAPDAPGRAQALKSLREAGVGSVGVLWDGTEPPGAAAARWPGFSITWRPSLKKFSEGGRPLPWGEWQPSVPPGPKRAGFFLPSGSAYPPAGAASPLPGAVTRSDVFIPYMEFAREPAMKALAWSFPDRVVRAHSIDEDELLRLTPAGAISRFLRAVRERGIRYLYVHMFPGLSNGENWFYVAKLAAVLRDNGFENGLASPRGPSAPSLPGPIKLRQCLAFLAAVLGPWWIFRRWGDRPLVLGPLAVGAALVVAALLSSKEFMLGLAEFRGVKAAMALPFLLAATDMYKRDELKGFLRRPLTVGAAVGFSLLALAAIVCLLRSGNESALGASAGELRVRDGLETLLGVRPRFKEFAVGWPLLWLGSRMRARGERLWGADGRAFLFAGFVAPVSIVNTFCHAHVPLAVSLFRVFHGFWLGGLAGFLLILLEGKLLRRFVERPPAGVRSLGL